MVEHSYIFDVTEETYDKLVMQAPPEITVMVDFWAPWCAPCHALSPTLEKLVEDYGGRVMLAKVNVDQNPHLSQRFGVQGIPNVKVVKNGEVVDQFTGALPEFEIQRILDKYVTTEIDEQVREAKAMIDRGETEAGEAQLREILQKEPHHSMANLALAQLCMQRGNCDVAEEAAQNIQIGDPDFDQAEQILNQIFFIRECGQSDGREALEQHLAQNPDDLDAHYAHACCLAAQSEYREALEEFLNIIKTDRKFRDGSAKSAMVRIFSIIGQRHELADEYRDKLELVLY